MTSNIMVFYLWRLYSSGKWCHLIIYLKSITDACSISVWQKGFHITEGLVGTAVQRYHLIGNLGKMGSTMGLRNNFNNPNPFSWCRLVFCPTHSQLPAPVWRGIVLWPRLASLLKITLWRVVRARSWLVWFARLLFTAKEGSISVKDGKSK